MAATRERKTRTCILETCAGERFDLVHKFPMENQRAADWLQALDMPALYKVPLAKLRSSYFICSRHFRNKDYKNALSRHLNKTAIPCVNLKTLDELDAAIDRCAPAPTNNRPVVVRNGETASTSSTTAITPPPLTETCGLQPAKLMKSNSGDRIDSSTCYSPQLGFDVELETKVRNEIDVLDKLMMFDIKELQGSHYCEDVEKVDQSGEEVELIEAADFVSDIEEDNERHSDDTVIFSADEFNTEDNVPEDSECSKTKDDATASLESEMASNLLEIRHPDYPVILSLDNIWLRDHCRCVECYNTETRQRKQNILEIPLDVKPTETDIRENLLWIKWNDEHESRYDFDFLHKSQLGVSGEVDEYVDRILWDQDKVYQFDYAREIFNNFLTDDKVAKSVVRSLVQFGFAFIEKVPPNANMTEAAIRRLFPIQKTFFGDMWTFSDEKDHSDTAYTKEYLGSHTDNTYFNDAAGLQVLHCIKHTGSGGETFLVDGFKILNDFKVKNPEAYNRLTTINVPAEYIEDGAHYTHTAPIIKLDPITQRPEQIRYNVYDRSVFNSIPQSEMYDFYKDFRSLAHEINDEVNQWRFKLNPGTVLIFDNWRVLHGREKYTGKRQISGCYVARCEFLNAARVMGLIS